MEKKHNSFEEYLASVQSHGEKLVARDEILSKKSKIEVMIRGKVVEQYWSISDDTITKLREIEKNLESKGMRYKIDVIHQLPTDWLGLHFIYTVVGYVK